MSDTTVKSKERDPIEPIEAQGTLVDPKDAKKAVKEAKKAFKAAKKAAKKAKKAEKKAAKAEKKEAKRARKEERRIAKKARKEMKKAEKRGQVPLSSSPLWQPVLEKTGEDGREEVRPLTKKERKAEKKAAKAERKRTKRLQKAFKKAEKRRLSEGRLTLYEQFECTSFQQLEELLLKAETREEKAFYRSVINLKLQAEQEKVIGEVLF